MTTISLFLSLVYLIPRIRNGLDGLKGFKGMTSCLFSLVITCNLLCKHFSACLKGVIVLAPLLEQKIIYLCHTFFFPTLEISTSSKSFQIIDIFALFFLLSNNTFLFSLLCIFFTITFLTFNLSRHYWCVFMVLITTNYGVEDIFWLLIITWELDNVNYMRICSSIGNQ